VRQTDEAKWETGLAEVAPLVKLVWATSQQLQCCCCRNVPGCQGYNFVTNSTKQYACGRLGKGILCLRIRCTFSSIQLLC
jgi:hypothetical protein